LHCLFLDELTLCVSEAESRVAELTEQSKIAAIYAAIAAKEASASTKFMIVVEASTRHQWQ
jgi:hypothetical protein